MTAWLLGILTLTSPKQTVSWIFFHWDPNATDGKFSMKSAPADGEHHHDEVLLLIPL